MAQKVKNRFISIFLSLRWPNLLITSLTLFICYFYLFIPIQSNLGLNLLLEPLDFFLLLLSVLFIMSGGYIINDLMDVESDLVNQKSPGIKWIPRKFFWTYYLSFSLIGLLLALWLCLRISMPYLWSIQLISFALLLLYSTNLKSTPLAGNILVSALSGLIPLLPLLFNNGFEAFSINPNYIILYFLSFFAFLISLIRELVKDMEDELGDRESNLATFPVVFGIEASRWTCFIFFMLFLVLLISMLYLLAGRDLISLYYLLITVMIPMIWLSYQITVAQSREDFHGISRNLKYVRLRGLSYGIIYHFSFL